MTRILLSLITAAFLISATIITTDIPAEKSQQKSVVGKEEMQIKKSPSD